MIQNIPLINLALAFIPVAIAMGIMVKVSLKPGKVLYALCRMLIQLLLIGYFLTYIFNAQGSGVIIAVLTVMVLAASWIALGNVPQHRLALYKSALLATLIGGGFTLALITQLVLELKPWYWPQYMIPLAGMIFANAMNSVSLAAERLIAELQRGVELAQARHIALQAALIPITNSLFAVGLVSLPGMMTGQILSGVSPLIAVRYQIMVMCMTFASAVICAALFLWLVKGVFEKIQRNKSES
jgi:putative ABC transport system permease protein